MSDNLIDHVNHQKQMTQSEQIANFSFMMKLGKYSFETFLSTQKINVIKKLIISLSGNSNKV